MLMEHSHYQLVRSLIKLNAISQARNNGHYVFLCTGRNKAGIRSLLPIGFDGAICSAGVILKLLVRKFMSHV